MDWYMWLLKIVWVAMALGSIKLGAIALGFKGFKWEHARYARLVAWIFPRKSELRSFEDELFGIAGLIGLFLFIFVGCGQMMSYLGIF